MLCCLATQSQVGGRGSWNDSWWWSLLLGTGAACKLRHFPCALTLDTSWEHGALPCTLMILTMACWLGFLAQPQTCLVTKARPCDLSDDQTAIGWCWLLSPDLLYTPHLGGVGLHSFSVRILPCWPCCHPQLLVTLQSSQLSRLPDIQVKFDSVLLFSFSFRYHL